MTRKTQRVPLLLLRVVLVVGLHLGTMPLVHARQPSPTAPTTQATIESDWDDLGGGEPKASEALLRLADQPDAFVAFAKDKFVPVKLTQAELAPMLKALDSDDEATWKAASQRLRYLDPRLAVPLEPLYNGIDSPRLQARLAEVLSSRDAGSLDGKVVKIRVFKDGANFVDDTGSWWAEREVAHLNRPLFDSDKPSWNRVIRGMVLLEHIGTPAARALTETMATGHPDAEPTRIAKDAIAARATR